MNEAAIMCTNCRKPVPAYAYKMHLAMCKRTSEQEPIIEKVHMGKGVLHIVEKRHDRICQFPHCGKKCWPNWVYCTKHHAAMTKAFGYAE